MRRISLVVVAAVASAACHREAPPSTPQAPAAARASPAAAPLSNRTAVRAEPRASSDILAFLPIESELVMRFDVKALRASALWAEFQPQVVAAIGAQLAALQAQCGFDPIQMIDSVTIGLRDTIQADGVVVIRGWDRDLWLACMEARPPGSLKMTSDPGILAVTSFDGHTRLGTFADRTTLVFEASPSLNRERLRAVIRSGVPLRRSPAFLAMLEQLEPGATLWFLLNGNARAIASANVGLKARGIYGSIHVAATLSAAAHVRMETAAQAAQLAASVDAQLQSARPFFDRLTASSDGEVLTVACELSSAQLRTLAGLAVSAYRAFGVKP